jgi:hypothetical protein
MGTQTRRNQASELEFVGGRGPSAPSPCWIAYQGMRKFCGTESFRSQDNYLQLPPQPIYIQTEKYQNRVQKRVHVE